MIAASFRYVVRWLRGQDLRLLGTLLAIAGLSWCFLELADVVDEGEAHGFDHALLLALRSDPGGTDPVGPPWLEGAVVNISALGSGAVATLVVLLVLGFLLLARKPRVAALVVACSAGGALAIQVLKTFYDRGRPDVVSVLSPAGGLSFPSGHATISAALYLTLGVLVAGSLEERRLRVYVVGAAAFLALLIGVSRVYLGVHYPTDVLAGWTLGLAWALVCGLVERTLQQRGALEPDGGDENGA